MQKTAHIDLDDVLHQPGAEKRSSKLLAPVNMLGTAVSTVASGVASGVGRLVGFTKGRKESTTSEEVVTSPIAEDEDGFTV